MFHIDDNTPIAMLTVGQLREVLNIPQSQKKENTEKKYVYGIGGIAKLIGCSMPTACRIKKSGKLDAAIKQIGRKIIVDAQLALDILSQKKEIGGAL